MTYFFLPKMIEEFDDLLHNYKDNIFLVSRVIWTSI